MNYKQWYKDLFYKKIKRPRMKWSYFNTIVDVNRIVINSGKNGITVSKISELICKSYRETLRIVYELSKAGFVCIIRGRRGRVVSNSDIIYQEFLISQKNMTNGTPTPLQSNIYIDRFSNRDSKKINKKYKKVAVPLVFLSKKDDADEKYVKIENQEAGEVFLFIDERIVNRWIEYYDYTKARLIQCIRRFLYWTQKCMQLKISENTELIGLLVKFVKNDFILNSNAVDTDGGVFLKSPMGVYIYKKQEEIGKFSNWFKKRYCRPPYEYVKVKYDDDGGVMYCKGIKTMLKNKYELDDGEIKIIRRKFINWVFEIMDDVPDYKTNMFGLFIKFVHKYIEEQNSVSLVEILRKHAKNEDEKENCEKNNSRKPKRGGEIKSIKEILWGPLS